METFGTKYEFQIKNIHNEIDHIVGILDDDTVDTIRNFVIISINEIQKIENIEKSLNDSIVDQMKLQNTAKKFIKSMEKSITDQADKNFVTKLKKTYNKNDDDISNQIEALNRLCFIKEILHKNIDVLCSNASGIDNENKDEFFDGYTKSLIANYKMLNSIANSKAVVELRPQDDADQYFRDSQNLAIDLLNKSIVFPEYQQYEFDDEEKTEAQEPKREQEKNNNHAIDEDYDPMLDF